jgi:uncharacterized membrane protein YGL010W
VIIMVETRTRPIDGLIATYSESHLHPANEAIHCVCVPAIVFALLGLLWALHPGVAVLLALASLAYYLWLSRPFAAGMVLMTVAMLGVLATIPDAQRFTVSLTVFVLAWIGQFIGHKIEGKKPSFFDDLRYLLIGPLFVLAVLYRRLKIAY